MPVVLHQYSNQVFFMSEERLLKLELKLDESTTAMVKLTNEISLLVQSNTHGQKLFEENKSITRSNTDRITALEQKSAVRDASGQKAIWIERTVVVGVVAAVLKGAGVI